MKDAGTLFAGSAGKPRIHPRRLSIVPKRTHWDRIDRG